MHLLNVKKGTVKKVNKIMNVYFQCLNFVIPFQNIIGYLVNEPVFNYSDAYPINLLAMNHVFMEDEDLN